MKVLHICIEKNWGGGELQATQLATGGLSKGITTWIVCKTGSQVHKFCMANSIPCHDFPFVWAFDLRSIIRLTRLIHLLQPDIVHLHSSKAHTLGLILSLLGTSHLSMMVTRRVNIAIKDNYLSQWKYNHPAIKKIICVSESVKQTTAKGVKDSQKLITVYGGVNIAATLHRRDQLYLKKAYPTLKDKNLIGFVGSLTEIKAPDTFVHMALKILEKRQDVHFVVIGDGNMRSELTHAINALHMGQYFTFTGFTDHNIEALSTLDLLVLTSKSEGLPNVLLEAAVLRVPIVATNVGGVHEFVSHGKTGMLCSADNTHQLIEMCLSILDNPDLADELAKGAQQKVKKFCHKEGLRKTIQVYEEIVASG